MSELNLGKYAVLSPVEYHFEKDQDLWWKFRPVTIPDEIELTRFVNAFYARGERPTWIEQALREIAIVFDGTNIAPDVKPGAPIQEVEDLLKALPPEMVPELWQALGEANPIWGPPRPRLPEAAQTNSTD